MRSAPLRASAAVVAALLVAAAPASARTLALGHNVPAGAADLGGELSRSAEAGSRAVRLNASWAQIAPQRPVDPGNPADSAYRFGTLDGAVRAASERGLYVILTVANAPAWAEGPSRPQDAPAGSWRPDADAFGAFGRALATRYGGNFSPGIGQPALPRVQAYQAWNEPNLTTYLSPQGDAERPESARLYRGLLTAFYGGVKSVAADSVVVSAGTAPYGGDTQGGRPRAHPVPFLRELLCVRGRSLTAAGCDAAVPIDVLAHHPINPGDPLEPAANEEDASTADLGRIRGVLKKAQRKDRVVPPGSRPIWVTEFWWESNPPDSRWGVPTRDQARYTAEALYLFDKKRVPLALGLQAIDDPLEGEDPGETLQTGLFFADGSAKPALKAFRFPLVADRGRKRTKIWGRAPMAGKVRLQQKRRGKWRRFATKRVGEAEIFKVKRRSRSRKPVRAKGGGERSLAYRPRVLP